jgi:glycosyltransferase involved in cell wall biosynthesis
MRDQIESQIRDLGIGDRVRLLGERQDVAKFLTAFDVFSLTSIAEGMSNTILEAMACGLPVVATRVGGNPELIEHHVNGQLVEVGDVRDIASAFQSYVDNANLRRDHARNARRIAEQKFSLERMAAQYAQLYQALGRTREDQAA